MGGRGAKAGLSAGSVAVQMTQAAANYKPYEYGQITRYEAGTIYRAHKNGDISVKPETISTLYDGVKEYIRLASQRYSQDHTWYDRIYEATQHILNNDYAAAQKVLDLWEADNIRLAGKKSRWYKYQKQKKK